MIVGPDTVIRLALEVLGQGMELGNAEDAARRLNAILGWVRELAEERLLDSEPAGVFDPAHPTWTAPPPPLPAWRTVPSPPAGTGYGAPPPGAPPSPAADRPPQGIPIGAGPASMSLAEVAREIGESRLSPVEAVEIALSRLEALDGDLRAFITVTAAEARATARLAEQNLSAGSEPGLLHGVPVAVKDVIDTAEVRTTCGSRVLAGRVPRVDAEVVSRLRRAGAIMVGKTNTHEFAFGVTTANPHFGICRNPWNPGCVPGGSSGGSAVAVATGMCYLALGTDTAGSVRIPAACCGVVGLKPTYGLIDKQGIFPLSWSLDHPGTLTRTVGDAALALTVLAGGGCRGRSTPPRGFRDYREAVRQAGAGLSDLTIGVPSRWLEDRVRPGVAAAVGEAIARFEQLGARVREVDFPPVHPLLLANRLIVLAEGAALHRPWMGTCRHLYGTDVRARLELGQLLPAVDYLTGQRLRRELGREVAGVMREVDLLATPTLPVPAPHIGEDWLEWPEGREAASDALIRLPAPFNVTGQPAISVPCGMSEGRPVGLQLAGRWFEEETLLRAAAALEATLGGR
ncbi:MAG: amidase [bacterium]|nr:amidase [bacterium]